MALPFLPMTKEEMEAAGINQPDFVYVCGDAYVDHSSFGCAIITRLLESRGYTICIISQPDWKNDASIRVFGEPKLAFLVSSGNMDSMVNHYTVNKKRRHTDSYSPGGKSGLRPDRAVTVYGNLIRRSYKKTPIILGGIEASLRRLGHYDYWSDSVRRSVLLDAGADLISYGMGEHSIIEIADALKAGIPISEITYIPGTVYRAKDYLQCNDPVLLPSFSEICADKAQYAKSFAKQYRNTDPLTAKTLVEDYGGQGYIIQNPPAMPLTTQEMDDVYELPFANRAHPLYDKMGGIPAIAEIRFSLTSSRGCFGGCNFCALTFHQGRIVQTRSHESLIREAVSFTRDPSFKGNIHDVGGPTADFRHPSCKKQQKHGMCTNRQCLFPAPCKNLDASHEDYITLLRKLRAVPGIKRVFIRSGIRFDYVLADSSNAFLDELTKYHVSGQLRVAPEHVSDRVLRYMGKPPHQVYRSFLTAFARSCRKAGKEQYAVPYFMSSHPGCTLKDAICLAEYIRDQGFMPEQVQDFYPTPSTISTCMYYTEIDPLTGENVYIPKSTHEKAMQRALMQYRLPANRKLVEEALRIGKRTDLIGYSKTCLLRPDKASRTLRSESAPKKKNKKTIRNVHKKKTR